MARKGNYADSVQPSELDFNASEEWAWTYTSSDGLLYIVFHGVSACHVLWQVVVRAFSAAASQHSQVAAAVLCILRCLFRPLTDLLWLGLVCKISDRRRRVICSKICRPKQSCEASKLAWPTVRTRPREPSEPCHIHVLKSCGLFRWTSTILALSRRPCIHP